MLQRLVLADRSAELHARLHVFDRHRQHRFHRADRLRAGRHDAGLVDALHCRESLTRFAEHIGGRDIDTRQRDVGGTRAVAHPVAAPRDPVRRRIDEKETDAVRVTPVARHTGADDQPVGAVTMHDHRLAAVEPPTAGGLGRLRHHVGEVVARLPLAMRHCEAQAAIDDLRHNRLVLCRAAGGWL